MKKEKNSQHYRKSPPNRGIDPLSGKILQLTVEKTVPGGNGLCRVDGQVVFVPACLPGEEIRIELGAAKGGYRPARLLEIVTSSPQRIKPPCPEFDRCGGCDFQYASPEYQLELKKANFLDTLKRQGGLDANSEGLEISLMSGDPLTYRNRLQFHKVDKPAAGGPFLGLYARDSRQVIALAACPVAAPEIQKWLEDLPDFEATPLLPGDLEETETATSSTTDPDERMRVFAAQGQLKTGNSEISLDIAGNRLVFSSGGFFQSNVAMLEKLLEWLEPRLGTGKRALDLYCGCGVFAKLLESSYSQVMAVDNLVLNCDYAKRNTDGLKTKVIRADVDLWLQSDDAAFADLVVVDPPRAGLSRALTEWLLQAKPTRIVYVSCNPVTFARDLKLLRQGGYTVAELALFDFYPQTWHSETACILEVLPG